MVSNSRFDDVPENHILGESISESSFRCGSSGEWVILSCRGLHFRLIRSDENNRSRSKDKVVVLERSSKATEYGDNNSPDPYRLRQNNSLIIHMPMHALS